MTTPGPKRFREQLMVRVAGGFAQVSVDVFEPARKRATIFGLHDFAGNGQDFAPLATMAVAHGYRVICPDMVGRGESAFMSDVGDYNIRTHLTVIRMVMENYADKHIIMVGKRWGALLTLLLINTAKFDLRRLILADLPLDMGSETEPALRELAEAKEFPTLEQALEKTTAMEEFKGLSPEASQRLAAGRLRRTQSGYAIHFDPQLVEAIAHLSGRRFDVLKLMLAVKSRLLLINGSAVGEEQQKVRLALADQVPELVQVDGLRPGGRIHFDTAHQLLLTLGFLINRRPFVR